MTGKPLVFQEFRDGPHPHHLPLMNLTDPEPPPGSWNADISLRRIDAILNKYGPGTFRSGIIPLIRSDDRRQQLVGCIAILKLNPEERKELTALSWERVENGSWIIPQIMVILSFLDRGFIDSGRQFIGSSDELNHLDPEDQVDFIIEKVCENSCPSEIKGRMAMRWRKRLLALNKAGKTDVL